MSIIIKSGSDGNLANVDSNGNLQVLVSESNTVNVAGSVSVSNFPTSVAVTGMFYQATQPVSGTVAVSGVSGVVEVSATSAANSSGNPIFVETISGSTTVVTGSVTVSGTATVAQGTATSASGAWPVYETVSGTAIDPRLIRALTSADQITIANASIAVTGAFYQATQPVSGTVAVSGVSGVVQISATSSANSSGNPIYVESISGSTTTVTQGTAANLNATVIGTGTFAVQAAQSGNWSARMQDGSGNALTSTSNALDVNIKTSAITLTATSSSDATAGASSPTTGTQVGGTDVEGKFRYTASDVYGDLQTQIGGAQTTAFGWVRVAEPQTLFSMSNRYDLNSTIMAIVTSGTGSVTKTTNVSSATLSTGGTVASASALYQSYQYHRYEPGKSQLILMTGVLGAYTRYVRKMIGYGDTNDGVFFDMDGTTAGANAGGASGVIAVTLRSSTSGSPVDTQILQTNWNIDKMDGTGVSGITLDFTKTQIFIIDLQWLGVGRIRFGVDVNGIVYYCHQIVWANVAVSTAPYMNTANLPIRWYIANDSAHAAAGTTTMYSICGTVQSEGGSQAPNSTIFSADNGVSTTSVGTTALIPLVEIAPALTYSGVSNRTIYKALSTTVINTSDTTGKWALLYNPSLVAPSFVAINNSGVTYDTSASGLAPVITAISTTGGVTTITWAGNSIAQGANNRWLGYSITIAGFTAGNAGNNGTFTITASTNITLTYANASGTSAGAGGGTTFTVLGIQVASGYFSSTGGFGGGNSTPVTYSLTQLDLPFTINAQGTTSDVYCLAAIGVGTSALLGQITWSEDR